MGFCPQCRSGELVAREDQRRAAGAVPISAAALGTLAPLRVGDPEVDRVLGGGLVPGSVALLAGEPGVGKSTLLLAIASSLAGRGRKVLFVSAEESLQQIGLRAARIDVDGDRVLGTSETDIDAILATLEHEAPDVALVDSIQAVSGRGSGSKGGPGRIRDNTARLIAFAKRTGTALVVVGHVTKDGSIAGPKVLEHMVDVVVVLEGDSHRDLRFLRGTKNRYGSVSEVGVFEMRDSGLHPVDDPSALLARRVDQGAPGSVLFPSIEGRRSLVVEIQALVVPSRHHQPRRSVKGVSASRVHQVLAVLERHAGLSLLGDEVHVSIMGGLRIAEPAVDLPVAVALASSATGREASSLAAWGEVGLTGELRAASHERRRRLEAKRIGADRLVAPAGEIRTLSEALSAAGVVGTARSTVASLASM